MNKDEIIDAINEASGDAAKFAEQIRIRRYQGKALEELDKRDLEKICRYAGISMAPKDVREWNALLGKFQAAYDYAMQTRRINAATGEASLGEVMTVGDAYDYQVPDEDTKLEKKLWQDVQQAAQACKAHRYFEHPMCEKWHKVINECANGSHRYMVF